MIFGGGKKAVGLEIDSGSARVVEVSGNSASPRLTSMASVPIPDGAMEEGVVVRPADVGEALRRLWSSGAIKHRKVILGVSNQGVLVRHATIPKVPKDKIKNVIHYHAQEFLPIPVENVVLGHLIVGEVNTEDSSMYEVLLVAARRDMLYNFLEALSLAKLEPQDIDVSTLALMHILPPSSAMRTVAVVNVANGLSNILVTSQGKPRLARIVSAKTKDLADTLNCSLADVIKVATMGPDQQKGQLDNWVNNLVSETSSSITYYQNQPVSSEVEAVIINGRGARIPGIATRLEERLGLPVRIVNPFSHYTNAGSKTKGSGLQAVEYAICAGLARRGLEEL